jgi:hypothetical protein
MAGQVSRVTRYEILEKSYISYTNADEMGISLLHSPLHQCYTFPIVDAALSL